MLDSGHSFLIMVFPVSQNSYSLSLLTPTPVAKKQPHQLTAHQLTRTDNYYWMRDDERENADVLAHLHAENEYCEKQLASIKPLREALFNELKERIVKDDNTFPVKDGLFWYHSEVRGDDEYARHYRSSSIEAHDKQLLLDVNQLASDYEFYELGEVAISPDEQLLAYSEDTEGRRIYTARFKNIASGEIFSDVLENTEGQIVWANDSKTVFYVKKDLQTLLGFQVYRHVLFRRMYHIFVPGPPNSCVTQGRSGAALHKPSASAPPHCISARPLAWESELSRQEPPHENLETIRGRSLYRDGCDAGCRRRRGGGPPHHPYGGRPTRHGRAQRGQHRIDRRDGAGRAWLYRRIGAACAAPADRADVRGVVQCRSGPEPRGHHLWLFGRVHPDVYLAF